MAKLLPNISSIGIAYSYQIAKLSMEHHIHQYLKAIQLNGSIMCQNVKNEQKFINAMQIIHLYLCSFPKTKLCSWTSWPCHICKSIDSTCRSLHISQTGDETASIALPNGHAASTREFWYLTFFTKVISCQGSRPVIIKAEIDVSAGNGAKQINFQVHKKVWGGLLTETINKQCKLINKVHAQVWQVILFHIRICSLAILETGFTSLFSCALKISRTNFCNS